MASNSNLKARVACLEQRVGKCERPIIIRRLIAPDDGGGFAGITVNGVYMPCSVGQSASELEQQAIAEIRRQGVAGRFLFRKVRTGAATDADEKLNCDHWRAT
ncbi:hypothetical protein [Paraburkholderia sp.]|uniref:hypothetical protein n=1 Tax=Paraburkholderia sp. TaxID=1926495 RepID=UPI0039E49D25